MGLDQIQNAMGGGGNYGWQNRSDKVQTVGFETADVKYRAWFPFYASRVVVKRQRLGQLIDFESGCFKKFRGD